ncbi:MAG: hypothetical protein AAGD11_03000 [Planctomycetota bacterium]
MFELRRLMQSDEEFYRRLLRAEATPEFNHMRNVYNAAKDEKHWRASVWWLERRAPDRYARQLPETVTAAQLRNFVDELSAAIVGEVENDQDRERMLARLVSIAKGLREAALDPSMEALPADANPMSLRNSTAGEAEKR